MGRRARCGAHSAKPGCLSPCVKIQDRTDFEQIRFVSGFLCRRAEKKAPPGQHHRAGSRTARSGNDISYQTCAVRGPVRDPQLLPADSVVRVEKTFPPTDTISEG